MSDANFSGALPKGDANGLSPIIGPLIDKPHSYHVVLAILDCAKITTNNDTGEVIPTARIRRIEAVLPGDLESARRLMDRALEKRTGRTMLPMDLEDDLRAAFEGIDPRTGEKPDSGDGQSPPAP
jgi:hypothetical protein